MRATNISLLCCYLLHVLLVLVCLLTALCRQAWVFHAGYVKAETAKSDFGMLLAPSITQLHGCIC